MRAFLLFFGLMLGALASVAIFTYPAWLLLHPHFDWPFHRIGERIGMLALVIGFILVARRVGLSDKQSVGYALPRPLFIREMLTALLLGVIGMGAIVGIMTALGLLDWTQASTATGGKLAKIIFNRLLSGLAVGFIEETMLRGVMFAAIQRESGTKWAIFLTSVIYAAVHFLAKYYIPPEQVTSHSGFTLLAGMTNWFSRPLEMADAYMCLFAVGMVLAIIRARRGNIAACIGMHAGWVWVMLIARELTDPIRDQPLSFLLSQFDGFIGWLVFAWTVLTAFFLVRLYPPRTSPPQTS
jgi:membrane protease YdiL (CAAX protease family)